MPTVAVRRPLVVATLIAVLLPVRASAAGLGDPLAAKAADACQRALAKAGAAFTSSTLKGLVKCYGGLFKCVQTKPGDQACGAKAAATCAAATTKQSQARAKLAAAVGKKCASFTDLANADGLGYAALASTCQTDFGVTLADVASVASCVLAEHECRSESAFATALPRAAALAADFGVSVRAGSCLVNHGGAGDVADPKGRGKALDACQKAITQAGSTFTAAELKSFGTCVTTAFGCAQLKPSDAKCAAKAEAACDAAFDTTVPAAAAKAAAAIGKRCTAAFTDLGPAIGANFVALVATCQSVGVAALASIDDVAECVLRQHACAAEDVLAFAVPRAGELALTTGHTLAHAYCSGGAGATPTPTLAATPTSTVTPTRTATPTPALTPTRTATPTPTVTPTRTATPTSTVTPTRTATPTPAVTPTRTATPTSTPTLVPTPTATLTAAPGQVLLSVTKTGTGTGTVTFAPLGTTCGATCAVSVAPGTVITLQGRTQNGADSYFQGFTGGGCTGAERDCAIQVTANTTIGAAFAPQTFNLAFVTAAVYGPNLGGTGPYDAACNAAATAAGINNGAGDGYVAWLSDSGSPSPRSRLGSARGFVRLDGRPVADTSLDFTVGILRSPIRLDEHGAEAPSGTLVHTGTLSTGAVAADNCENWTTVSASELVGTTSGGPDRWTAFSYEACADRPLYCFGKTKTAALPTVPVAGKLIFYVPSYEPGSQDPDAFCEAHKPAGAGTVVALIARTTAAAATHLGAATVYVRPDGERVGTGQEIIDAAAGTRLLATGPWENATESYGADAVWTGAASMTAVPSSAETCNDWSSNLGTATIGNTGFIDTTFWSDDSIGCGSDFYSVYCVEQ